MNGYEGDEGGADSVVDEQGTNDENAAANPSFFNGRLLTASDLTREPAAVGDGSAGATAAFFVRTSATTTTE